MNFIKNYFLAARPSFLTLTLLGCAIGYFGGSSTGETKWAINFLAILIALLAHASGNVLNDYFDHLNGSDSINSERISPYTGGSRFIQSNIFSPKEILQFGLLLLIVASLLGLCLCYFSTWLLLPIGILGLILLWIYSAPPLKLMSRGLAGEIAIAASWSLIVIGFATLQSNHINLALIPTAAAFGFMVANILFLNQIPDINADRNSQKFTLASKSRPEKLWLWYIFFVLTSYVLQIIAVYWNLASSQTLLTILAAPFFAFCAIKLRKGELNYLNMKTMIPVNIAGVHLYGVLICAGLMASSKFLF